MQIAMGRSTGFYLIEVISEKFDRLPESEKTKTIIHELMHIPKTFGGGFIHHNMVHEGSVRDIYKKYINLKQNKQETTFPSITVYEKPVQQTPAPLKINMAFKESMKNMEKKFRWF